jgi:pimeloyl-ACP methyl ester carboxylesterase
MKKLLIGTFAFIVVLVLALGIASIFYSPVLEKPTLTGKFLVGFLETTITDPSRTMLQNQPRVISLDVWYPASSTSNASLEPFDTAALRAMLQKIQNIPSIGGDSPSHSYRNAPALIGQHKVILFNHGFASFTRQNFSNMEELASHGYVVISIGHPEDSLLSRDAAGLSIEINTQSQVYQKLQAITKHLQTSVKTMRQILEMQRQAKTLAEHQSATQQLRRHEQFASYKPQIKVWAEDTEFVIKSLKSGMSALPNVNPDWIVVAGHSLGGIVALKLATAKQSKLRGVISLDGPWISNSLNVPALILASTDFQLAGENISLNGTFNQALNYPKGAYILEPDGASHMNFTDLNYVPIIKLFAPILGRIDGKRMGTILNGAMLEYLQRLEQNTDFSKELLPTTDDLHQVVFGVAREP